MFRVIEVAESSPVGFSEATKAAVEKVMASGESVYYFEVVEQRGAVRDGKFKEFQVTVKVAVADK